jgi:cell division protein FtsB
VKRKAKSRRPAFKARYLFAAGILAVAVLSVFGDKGLIDAFKLKHELDGIRSFNASLDRENGELKRMIGLLKTDNRYIEHIAKTELGMIGRDEILYKIEKPE